jgi:UDP-N-acetylglucosamine acyltransferase
MSIHSSAIVHPDAFVDPSSQIGPHVVIDGPARIGPGCIIFASAVVLGATEIGAGCRIHSHAVIGDIPQDRAYNGTASFCRVGSGCILREGVTIHRATGEGEATILGEGCHLMTNAHVAHNCILGQEVTLVSGALLGGYVHVGDRAIISGNAAVHQFVRIGELAMIGGLSKVVQDIPPFLMTDQDGSVVGVNSVGLLRAGIALKDRLEIKSLYKLIYRSGTPMQRALELAEEMAVTEVGCQFISFLALTSRRGIGKQKARKRNAA